MSCALGRSLAGPAVVPLTVSVVMPTKNRPRLLLDAVRVLLAQTQRPDELIVVDQSDDETGAHRVAALVATVPAAQRPRLVYIHDPTISGAAAARNAGFDRATGDIVVCCDDDVLPEPTVIERLLTHYRVAPEYAALAPVITNYAPPSLGRRLYRAVFCRGPFRDERQPVYWFWRQYPRPARVPVRMFTGAMMSFRRSALEGVRHDARYRGASTGEDVDLCWTLWRQGARLAIVTDAQILHNRAPRPAQRPEEAQIASWGFLYQKHLPKTLATRAAFAWYIVGVFIGALVSAVHERTLDPLRSAGAGVRSVWTDHADSRFLAPVNEERPGPAGA
jgi:GT2 family glycosyltransferase